MGREWEPESGNSQSGKEQKDSAASGRLKKLALMLLVSAIVVAGSILLPLRLFEAGDRKKMSAIFYSEDREEATLEHRAISMPDKLSLLAPNRPWVQYIALLKGSRFTWEEAVGQAKAEFALLETEGILPALGEKQELTDQEPESYGYDAGQPTACLAVDAQNPSTSLIVWSGLFYTEKGYLLWYLLDDETGKILGFRYGSQESYGDFASSSQGGRSSYQEYRNDLQNQEFRKKVEKFGAYLGMKLETMEDTGQKDFVPDQYGYSRETERRKGAFLAIFSGEDGRQVELNALWSPFAMAFGTETLYDRSWLFFQ